jgi:hypothetical protein
VACAGGERVLGAGEIGFELRSERWAVAQVSNHSTGYCPDPESWSPVAAAIDRVGFARPAGFTQEVAFRCCTACREVNIVREDFFVCVFCEEDLPTERNIGASA